jgi:hypothetical protein
MISLPSSYVVQGLKPIKQVFLFDPILTRSQLDSLFCNIGGHGKLPEPLGNSSFLKWSFKFSTFSHYFYAISAKKMVKLSDSSIF